MTPSSLKSTRQSLGYTTNRFARLVGASSGRTVRRWEAGERAIPQHVPLLVEIILRFPHAKRFIEEWMSPGTDEKPASVYR
jgi:DNA-binding transcriptional regulator YiaG